MIFVFTLALISPVASADLATVLEDFSQEEIVSVGENVYQTPGQQTCLKCHRAGGEGEGWAGASDLRKPYEWNSFKALGGYEALEADPAQFRQNMETLLTYLITNGGLKTNIGFKKDHPEIKLDWSKTDGKKQFDMMMWGTFQKEMKKKIKVVQAELAEEGTEIADEDMRTFATYAVIEYIRGFEEANPDSPDSPLILKK